MLEGIAAQCGFSAEGGTRDHRGGTRASEPALAGALRLSWVPKVTKGFFLRAESFFNLAAYLDEVGVTEPLRDRSHGEAFLSVFKTRFCEGIFILDEPEAALSPQRQLALLRIMHDLERAGRSQFIIATHSIMLLSYPGACLYSLEEGGIIQTSFRRTAHYELMRDFVRDPELYFHHLFSDEGS